MIAQAGWALPTKQAVASAGRPRVVAYQPVACRPAGAAGASGEGLAPPLAPSCASRRARRRASYCVATAAAVLAAPSRVGRTLCPRGRGAEASTPTLRPRRSRAAARPEQIYPSLGLGLKPGTRRYTVRKKLRNILLI